jgi:hypothetical protein
MNIYEAKKFLNNNGYLLEDRFGGGKDRYGHKIKRLKLSDLDDGDEPAETEPAGDVEPSDLEPTEAPTEQPKTQPAEIKTNEDLLELTYTTLEDFPGYIDYDENGLTLVIHDLLQSKKDFLQRAGEIYGDIENSTNQKYEVALSELSFYMKKDKKNMETKIKGFLIDYIDYLKFNLRESGCDNILSVDIDLDYEKLYNACGDASVYVEQLNGLNEKCNLVKQYLANWIEVNLGTK